MCNPEALPSQAVQEVTGNRFARRKTNAVHKAVKGRPGGGQIGKQLVDLRVIAHVTVKYQAGTKVGGKFGDALFETLADVAESQFGALGVAGLGNAVGDGAV